MPPFSHYELIPYVFLASAALGALFGRGHAWLWLTVIAALTALGMHIVAPIGFSFLVLCALACFLYGRLDEQDGRARLTARRIAPMIGVVVTALALGLHVVPGFHNIQIAQSVIVKPHDSPFSLWLDFDKTGAGVLIAGFCYRRRRGPHAVWMRSLATTAGTIAAVMVILMAISVASGYTGWQPGISPLFLEWAPTNLLLTCESEEAFFRGFIQAEFQAVTANSRLSPYTGLAVSAILFGLAHAGGVQPMRCWRPSLGLDMAWFSTAHDDWNSQCSPIGAPMCCTSYYSPIPLGV